MPSTNYAYVNGRFVPEADATVSIFDRGFLYGDGVFETMRVLKGKIFRLSQHLRRMDEGLKHLHFDSPLDNEEIRAVLLELVGRNRVEEGFARIYLTRGWGNIGLGAEGIQNRSVVALAQSRIVKYPHQMLTIISSSKIDEESPMCLVKSANRLPYVLAKLEASRGGVHDAVLLNRQNKVVEFTTSNLFVARNGELFTPPLTDGALPGITRDVVLVLAAKLAIPFYEMSFGTEIFTETDEVFATNSIVGIEPVDEVDGAKFPNHHLAMRLRDAYRELVQEELGL